MNISTNLARFAEPEMNTPKSSVLVVDDEPEIVSVIEEILRRAGWHTSPIHRLPSLILGFE